MATTTPMSMLRTDWTSPQALQELRDAEERQRAYQRHVQETIRGHNRGRNIIKAAGYIGGGAMMTAGALGMLPGQGAAQGVGALATGLPASGTTAAAAAPTAGITLGTGGATLPTFASPSLIGGAGTTAAATTAAGAGGGGGSLLGTMGLGSLTGRDLATLGVGGINAATNIYGTRAANSAAQRAAEAQQRQFEETQKFLASEAEKGRLERAEVEAEKKRQWDAEQAENLRKWWALQPWRDSSQRNLTGMNEMLDRPKPQPVAPQFFLTQGRG